MTPLQTGTAKASHPHRGPFLTQDGANFPEWQGHQALRREERVLRQRAKKDFNTHASVRVLRRVC